MDDAPPPRGELLLYQSEDGRTRVACRFESDTLWLSQALIARLFETTPQNVTMHLRAIYASGELDAATTCKDFLQVQEEGSRAVRRSVRHYNLDAILAVGYRVRSPRGVQFRRWATERLREYVVKGFLLGDERLRNRGARSGCRSGTPSRISKQLPRGACENGWMEEDTSNPGRGGYGHALDPSGGVGEGQGHRSGGDREGRGDRGGVGDPLTDAIIGACIEVHRHLGPGLLESAYESCLCHELALRGLGFERQRPVPLRYKGVRLECGYRADVIVERRVLVELKTVEQLLPIHVAQTATYLRLSDLEVALLVNFNVPALRRGLRRIDRKPSPISAPSPISPSKYTPATTQHRPGIQEAIS